MQQIMSSQVQPHVLSMQTTRGIMCDELVSWYSAVLLSCHIIEYIVDDHALSADNTTDTGTIDVVAIAGRPAVIMMRYIYIYIINYTSTLVKYISLD